MNKFSMNNKNTQAGFTLIELIVVIVILGILAATALPRFSNLGGDARAASLQAARGAMSATAAMAHGKYLVTSIPAEKTSLTIEGATITFTTPVITGYPVADAGFVQASGLTDYTTLVGPQANTATSPALLAGQIAVIPAGITGTPTALRCFITYTQPTAVNTAPVYSAVPLAADCE